MCLDMWTLLQEYGENVQDQNNHVWSKRKYELELQLIALGLTMKSMQKQVLSRQIINTKSK